jgi:RNA polymerase sigma factor (sigma-70 family)
MKRACHLAAGGGDTTVRTITSRGTIMTEQEMFEELVGDLAANSHTAAEEVVRRYYTRVVAVLRRRIGEKYRAKVDAESIANSAMKSLWRDMTQDDLALTDWQDLWNLLAKISLNKLSNRVRRFQTDGRDAGKEEGIDAGREPAGRPGGPELDAIAADLYDRLVAGVTPRVRDVLDLSLQGYTVKEVADQIKVSTRTVKRIRAEYQQKMKALTEAE